MSKTVPLSVRLSAGDAEFLARVKIDDATTPSEKLRALLKDERRRREGRHEYDRVLALAREDSCPALQRIQEAENRFGVNSEVIHLVADRLPALSATLETALANEDGDQTEKLRELEGRLVDLIFGLAEAMLRLGVTKAVRGFDPDVVSDRIEPLLEIVDIVRVVKSQRKES